MTDLLEDIWQQPLGNTKFDLLFHRLTHLMDFDTLKQSIGSNCIDKLQLYAYMGNRFSLIKKVYSPLINETDHKDNVKNECLCNTHIIHHYQIVNDDTGFKCWVGSECINYFGNKLKNELHDLKVNEKYGSVNCLYCEDRLENRKLKIQRDANCCDDICYSLYCKKPDNYKLPKGTKFEGSNFSLVMSSNSGKSYLKWIYEKKYLRKHTILWELLEQQFKNEKEDLNEEFHKHMAKIYNDTQSTMDILAKRRKMSNIKVDLLLN